MCDTVNIRVIYKNCIVKADLSFMRKPSEKYIELENEDSLFFLDLMNKKLLLKENSSKEYEDLISDNELFVKQAKDLINFENNNKSEIKRLYNFSKFIN